MNNKEIDNDKESDKESFLLQHNIMIILISILILFKYVVLQEKAYELLSILLFDYGARKMFFNKGEKETLDYIMGICVFVLAVIFFLLYLPDSWNLTSEQSCY